jgi:hypothetical protein
MALDRSPWFLAAGNISHSDSIWLRGAWGWQLADDVQVLSAPIPVRGQQGLWNFDMEAYLKDGSQ